MYTLVRRFIKTGIGFLFVGLGIGLFMLAQRELFGMGPHPYLRSAHMHAIFSGFVMFLILGVALWLFPRAPKEDSRYRPQRIEAAYWILTVSTAVRVGTEGIRPWWGFDGLPVITLAGGLGQVIGFAIYFHAMWPRIRPVGSHLREARGERF